MGDALLQKKCSTETIPFQKIRNKGIKEQYYVKNSHPPIISRETFEKVQRLMKTRRVQNGQRNLTYPLQKCIYCGDCGSVFRRKTCNDKSYWVCNRHNQNREFCPIPQIREDEFYTAFMRLYNKLRNNRHHILYPVLEQLRVLKEQAELENKLAMAIKKEIIELTERNLMLNRLRSKGYLDSALFIEQSNELNAKLAERRTALRHTLKSDEYEDGIDEIERLIDIVEDGPDALEQFDAALFGKLVERIVVDSLEHIRFELYGGLEFPDG